MSSQFKVEGENINKERVSGLGPKGSGEKEKTLENRCLRRREDFSGSNKVKTFFFFFFFFFFVQQNNAGVKK